MSIPLEKDEVIVAEVRKHWFIFFLEGLASFVAALAPLIALSFTPFEVLRFSAQGWYLVAFGYVFWLLLVWIYFFLIWTDYYLDVWIITNQKLISVDQKALFDREVSSLRLDHIQDVAIEVNGFLPTLIDYGHLHVQTAGKEVEFIMKNGAHPQKVKEIIMREYRRELESNRRPITDPAL